MDATKETLFAAKNKVSGWFSSPPTVDDVQAKVEDVQAALAPEHLKAKSAQLALAAQDKSAQLAQAAREQAVVAAEQARAVAVDAAEQAKLKSAQLALAAQDKLALPSELARIAHEKAAVAAEQAKARAAESAARAVAHEQEVQQAAAFWATNLHVEDVPSAVRSACDTATLGLDACMALDGALVEMGASLAEDERALTAAQLSVYEWSNPNQLLLMAPVAAGAALGFKTRHYGLGRSCLALMLFSYPLMKLNNADRALRIMQLGGPQNERFLKSFERYSNHWLPRDIRQAHKVGHFAPWGSQRWQTLADEALRRSERTE